MTDAEKAKWGFIPSPLSISGDQHLGGHGKPGVLSVEKFHVDPVTVAKLLFSEDIERDPVNGVILPAGSATPAHLRGQRPVQGNNVSPRTGSTDEFLMSNGVAAPVNPRNVT